LGGIATISKVILPPRIRKSKDFLKSGIMEYKYKYERRKR
jgi:hypothetical protein